MLFDQLGLWLNVAILVFGLLAIIVGIWCFVLQIQIVFRYIANNRRHIGGKTAKEVAEEMLARMGYDDIQVVRASYLWMILFPKWGNRYSPRRRKILLYGNILKKDTVTAVAIATQKVGLVVQYKENDKKMLFRAKWEPWTRLAPNLILPLTTIGVVIDLFVNQWAVKSERFGIITLVFLGFAILYSILALYVLFLIVPTERRAGEIAMSIIDDNNLIPADYARHVQTLYATYVKKYIADFLMALIEIIINILRVCATIAKLKKN